MKTVIIIGGNRGIGFGFVKQYLAANFNVIATYRDELKIDALTELKGQYPNTLSLYKLEVTNIEEVNKFTNSIRGVLQKPSKLPDHIMIRSSHPPLIYTPAE
jgi:NAD(P)-dependent dehydrogenase (short-subunit alcohol dehydrogenase family)